MRIFAQIFNNMADSNRKDVGAGFRVDPDIHEKLKRIAYWERKTLKEVAGDAFEAYIKKCEKAHGGEYNPIPKS